MEEDGDDTQPRHGVRHMADGEAPQYGQHDVCHAQYLLLVQLPN